MSLSQLLQTLEQERSSTVVLYILSDAKQLESSDSLWLYRALQRTLATTPTKKLDVVLHSGGGVVSAAHKIAKLFRHYSKELSLLITYKARSAATLLCLGADHLVMTPHSELSPLDPQLAAQHTGQGQPAMISSEDIKSYLKMATETFELTTVEGRALAFKSLTEQVFPPTLGAFYRAEQHMTRLADDLLASWCQDSQQRQRISKQLISGYFSHDYAINREEAKTLGLNVQHTSLSEEKLLLELCDVYTQTLKQGANAIIGTKEMLFTLNNPTHDD